MAAVRRPLTEEEAQRVDAMTAARTSGTYYDILNVHAAATTTEIEQAYHDLARQWHPDRFYSRDTGERAQAIEENFVAATRAFRTLREPLKRQGYNREAGIDARVIISEPPKPAPSVQNLSPLGSTGVSAGETSPGGTRVYEAPPPRVLRKPPPPPPPPPPKAPTVVDKIRQQLSEQLGKARAYYDQGKADFDAGRYAKAESALYLAMKFDEKNETYKALYEQAIARAREGRAQGFVQQAEQEESYQRIKEAIGFYQKAVECDPPTGAAFFRMARLLLVHEKDNRGALNNFRKAVAKEPRNITYRLALAELYDTLGMQANGLREVQAALEVDPKHDAAKALAKKLRR